MYISFHPYFTAESPLQSLVCRNISINCKKILMVSKMDKENIKGGCLKFVDNFGRRSS